MTYEEILSNLTVKYRGHSAAQCICPAHHDSVASLTVSHREGKTLLHCHAGCSTEDVLAAVGLTLKDLFDSHNNFKSIKDNTEKWKFYIEKREGKKIEAIYHYHNLAGNYMYTKVRLVGKVMRYGILKNSRFSYGLDGKKRSQLKAIYGDLQQISNAISNQKTIFYCEGEKDVDTLSKHGYHAITAGGVNDWQREFSVLFQNANVCVLADNDSKGISLANLVCSDLLNTAKEVKMLIPTPELNKGDITDYFKNHNAQEFDELIQNAPVIRNNTLLANSLDLSCFHTYDDKGNIKDIYDYKIVEYLKQHHHFFILKKEIYLYQNGVYTSENTSAILQTEIQKLIYTKYVKSNSVKRVFDLLFMDASLYKNFDDLNAHPARWINFKNGFWDPVENKMINHDPKYYSVNQIPHSFHPETKPVGELLEEWFDFIFLHADDREMFLQYAGLCLTTDTSMQKLLIIVGGAGSGKSSLINLLCKVVGSKNIANVSLSQLSERFKPYRLRGNLLNACSDLDAGPLENTGILKQLTGEDRIEGEQKHKDSVPFNNYAKLVFSTNELPTIKSEHTNGIYRRLLLLGMNRIPENSLPDFQNKIEGEIDYFIHIIVAALERMYSNKCILESENSKTLINDWKLDNDSVEYWLISKTTKDELSKIDRTEVYDSYYDFCVENGISSLSRVNFYKALRTKGFGERKSNGNNYIIGLSIKNEFVTIHNNKSDVPFI